MYRLVHVKETNLFPGEYPRRFFDSDREILRTSSMCHREDLTSRGLFFLSDFSSVKFIFENVAQLRPNLFGEKKEEKKNNKKTEARPRDGHLEHVCKISASISQKRRGHLTFCA